MAELLKYLLRIVGMAVCKNMEVKKHIRGIEEKNVGWIVVMVL